VTRIQPGAARIADYALTVDGEFAASEGHRTIIRAPFSVLSFLAASHCP
jgi:hypothetical protein